MTARAALEHDLQFIPTRDLLAEVEAWRWMALDVVELSDEFSRQYAEFQLAVMVAELERRQRLMRACQHDPLRPRWPKNGEELRSRIEAVKDRWPVAAFCEDVLGCVLERSGRDRFRTACPLGSHWDDSPSFTIYKTSRSWFCFGCHEGGDVIRLVGLVYGLDRFFDKLERLERDGGVR